jgi:hypothetical protein
MTDKQLKTIGEYVCVEIARNRKFRREVSRLPLGMQILFIIDHESQYQDEQTEEIQPKKQSRFKRFFDWMKNLFNKDIQLYGNANGTK